MKKKKIFLKIQSDETLLLLWYFPFCITSALCSRQTKIRMKCLFLLTVARMEWICDDATYLHIQIQFPFFSTSIIRRKSMWKSLTHSLTSSHTSLCVCVDIHVILITFVRFFICHTHHKMLHFHLVFDFMCSFHFHGKH